jgi:YHS domain-containing protein
MVEFRTTGYMKKITFGAMVLAGMLALPLLAGAGDDKAQKPKPYILNTCVVSGDKLGGMGKPYVFTYEGREIKLCCKSCYKDFKKDPAKYIKKIEEAEAKAKK